jgi:hypothetical protein
MMAANQSVDIESISHNLRFHTQSLAAEESLESTGSCKSQLTQISVSVFPRRKTKG